MSKARFNVTYAITTPESAQIGDYDETGSLEENVSLREAFATIHQTRTCHVDGTSAIEADSSGTDIDSVSIVHGKEFDTGAVEERTLHIPRMVSRPSARRIAKLIGVNIK